MGVGGAARAKHRNSSAPSSSDLAARIHNHAGALVRAARTTPRARHRNVPARGSNHGPGTINYHAEVIRDPAAPYAIDGNYAIAGRCNHRP